MIAFRLKSVGISESLYSALPISLHILFNSVFFKLFTALG